MIGTFLNSHMPNFLSGAYTKPASILSFFYFLNLTICTMLFSLFDYPFQMSFISSWIWQCISSLFFLPPTIWDVSNFIVRYKDHTTHFSHVYLFLPFAKKDSVYISFHPERHAMFLYFIMNKKERFSHPEHP